jgi:extracellular elastinolytic metalloproteinase
MNRSPRRSLGVRSLAVSGLSLALAAALVIPSTPALAREGARPCMSCDAAARNAPENYNARLDPAFAAELAKSGTPVVRAELSAEELSAETALKARISGLHVERDERSMLPVMVLSREPGGRLDATVRKGKVTPEQAARAFLAANKALYAISDEDLTSLATRYVTAPEGGATIVKFDQHAAGIEVFDAEFAVAMSRDLEIVATSGRIYPGLTAIGATAKFSTPEPHAISLAMKDLTGRELAPSDFAFEMSLEGGYKRFGFVPDRAASRKVFTDPIRVKHVLFPLAEGRAIPAYYLELITEGENGGDGPHFSYVVSAEDGTVLFRNNLVAHQGHTYRVYADNTGELIPWDGPTGFVGTPHPTGTPDGYQAPFATPNLVTASSLFGILDPWLAPGATETNGNNADAYLDLGTPDGFGTGDIRGAITATSTFDYTYNSALAAEDATNRQAAVVGMFYQVNWLHDWWYRHGFNEAAGNAQANNFGRGGVQNDSLRAEGQDRSGTDNANMSTPADGGRPRMQMYKFLAGGRLNPTRDGTFDMLIVAHELAHYLSNRLVGNASGLSNNQGRSMGEGWSDFMSVISTIREGDNLDGTYAVGGYTDLFFCNNSFVDNYYYSIRRYPMSSRKDKNPLTFKDIGAGITTYPGVSGNPCLSLTGSPSEVHNAGEIWSQVLWDGYVGLAKSYGTIPGRDKMMQYTIDGLKMTPSAPTFTQARDGIIAAANAANAFSNPIDAQVLWQAFAKRGMGTSAVSPASSSGTHAGVVEDFSAAAALPDDTIGVYSTNTFFLRNVHLGGNAELQFPYGIGAYVPLAGRWLAPTGPDTIGLYDAATGFFFLRNSNSPGSADFTFPFGVGGAAIPVTGDWNGDGIDTIGLYDPVNGVFFVRNTNTPGDADVSFFFGPQSSTFLPIAGDWDGNGTDTLGLYDPATGSFFLKNSLAPGDADVVVVFGLPGDYIPVAGDWNSDGLDTIGLYSPSQGTFFLRNTNAPGVADISIIYGPTGAVRPVTGNFDGQ